MPPERGLWKQRRTTANGFVTAGVDTINKHENFCRHLFDSCYPRKPQAQDTKPTKQAVRPRWKRREGPALERGCNSTFLFRGRAGKPLACFLFVLLFVCLHFVCALFFCFPKLLIYPGETYQQAERRGSWTQIGSLMYATGGQAFSRPSPF